MDRGKRMVKKWDQERKMATWGKMGKAGGSGDGDLAGRYASL